MNTLQLDTDDSYTFDNAASVYIGSVNICPIVKYRITCTDPNTASLVYEHGTVESGASTLCSSSVFGYDATPTSREVSAIEANFPSVLSGTSPALGQADYEGEYTFRVEAVHSTGVAYA